MRGWKWIQIKFYGIKLFVSLPTSIRYRQVSFTKGQLVTSGSNNDKQCQEFGVREDVLDPSRPLHVVGIYEC